MKSIKILAEGSQRFIKEVLVANEAYRKECKEAEAYNLVTKNDKLDEAERKRISRVYDLKEIFLDTKKASRTLTENYLFSKFAMTIAPEDEATLNNLNKIRISENEMRLYYEKYRNNPMALRRLQTIAKENKVDIHNSDLVDVIYGNLQDYDYYEAIYSDYERSCDRAIEEVINMDPSRFGEFDKIIVDIQSTAINNHADSIEKEFDKLEGKSNE